MDFDVFLTHFAEQYDDLNVSQLTENTRFKELEDYSSLVALLIITMIDEEFGVTISGDEMVKNNTIGELYSVVNSKM